MAIIGCSYIPFREMIEKQLNFRNDLLGPHERNRWQVLRGFILTLLSIDSDCSASGFEVNNNLVTKNACPLQ